MYNGRGGEVDGDMRPQRDGREAACGGIRLAGGGCVEESQDPERLGETQSVGRAGRATGARRVQAEERRQIWGCRQGNGGGCEGGGGEEGGWWWCWCWSGWMFLCR